MSIDPTTTATQLATAYTQPMQSLLTTQQQNAQTTSTALTTLSTALQNFDSALVALSSKKSVTQYAASFDLPIGTAVAAAGAQPGTYSVSVQQVASASQVSFDYPPAVPVYTGSPLTMQLADGRSFTINDLQTWDTDGNGQLSATELARAINAAPGNNGLINAGVVGSGGASKLVLTAGSTGAGSQISLDASAMPPGLLQDTLAGTPTTLVAAQDATATIAGLTVTQASNTFTAIPGVQVTVTQPGGSGTLTVTSDASGTQANVKSFVDAYNALNKSMSTLTAAGSPTDGSGAGAFVDDSGVLGLKDRLNQLVRQTIGGVSLASYGVSGDRDGNLTIDTTRLQSALARNPDGLDALFGNASLSAPSGLLGSLDKVAQSWTDAATGYLTKRQATVQQIQKSITDRQTALQSQYQDAYDRYLKQFTALQALQAQMSQTTNMFFSSSSSS
jgi:flagellar hook-associated protein 2